MTDNFEWFDKKHFKTECSMDVRTCSAINRVGVVLQHYQQWFAKNQSTNGTTYHFSLSTRNPNLSLSRNLTPLKRKSLPDSKHLKKVNLATNSKAIHDSIINKATTPRYSTTTLKQSFNKKSIARIINRRLPNYSNVKLTNDYLHIIGKHYQLYESTYNYLMHKYITDCSLLSCLVLLSRNNRDRTHLSSHNNLRAQMYLGYTDGEEIYTQQLLDKIHCNLLHCYDLGMKLHSTDVESIIHTNHLRNQSEIYHCSPMCSPQITPVPDDEIKAREDARIRAIMETRTRGQSRSLITLGFNSISGIDTAAMQMRKQTSKNSKSKKQRIRINMRRIYFDNGLQKMKRVLSVKRKHLENLRGRQRMKKNKFVTNIQDTTAGSQQIYFGYKFFYWKKSKCDSKWLVVQKYPHLRSELINNTIHRVSIDQFNDALKNAICLIHCKRGRKLRAKYLKGFGEPTIDEIGIRVNSSVTIDHMLAILFYVNYDQLQYSLRSTFYRQLDVNTHSQLIQTHQIFANWGRLLFEAIHVFGEDVCDRSTASNSSHKHYYYHCVDKCISFPRGLFEAFQAPMSTTGSLEACINYSNNNGLVLQLKADDVNGLQPNFDNYLDCSWISDFAYENECLFMQSLLRFSNIYEIQLNHSYKIFLKLFDTLDTMLNGYSTTYSIHITNGSNSVKDHSRDESFICKLFESVIECALSRNVQKYKQKESDEINSIDDLDDDNDNDDEDEDEDDDDDDGNNIIEFNYTYNWDEEKDDENMDNSNNHNQNHNHRHEEKEEKEQKDATLQKQTNSRSAANCLIPHYVSDFFHNTFNTKTAISLNLWLMNVGKFQSPTADNSIVFGYQSIQSLFLTTNADQNGNQNQNQNSVCNLTINFQRLYNMCPQVQSICFFRADCSKRIATEQNETGAEVELQNVNRILTMSEYHSSAANQNETQVEDENRGDDSASVDELDYDSGHFQVSLKNRHIVTSSVLLDDCFMNQLLHFLSEDVDRECKLQEIVFYCPLILNESSHQIVNEDAEDCDAEQQAFEQLVQLYHQKFHDIQWRLSWMEMEIPAFDECGEFNSIVVQNMKSGN